MSCVIEGFATSVDGPELNSCVLIVGPLSIARVIRRVGINPRALKNKTYPRGFAVRWGISSILLYPTPTNRPRRNVFGLRVGHPICNPVYPGNKGAFHLASRAHRHTEPDSSEHSRRVASGGGVWYQGVVQTLFTPYPNAQSQDLKNTPIHSQFSKT